ncbi:MAG TPA: DUF3575 domain-containing protein [Flavobacterium sp.]|jgi:hypothetical protein
MRRILFLFLIFSQFVQAQDTSSNERKNELRVDALSLIASGKWNLSYERFLNNDFSVGVTGSFSNSDKINEDYDRGFRNNSPKYEVIPFVRYALSKSPMSFYFAEVFVAANGGNSREIVRVEDGAAGFYDIQESEYTDVAIGGGLGYKFYFKEKFGIEFLVGFGSNLIDKSKSPDVVPRVGLSFGYRF